VVEGGRESPGPERDSPALLFLPLFTNVVERLSEKGVSGSDSLL
jgi:hypothetical protein